MSIKRKVVVGTVAVFLGMQFVRPERTNPPERQTPAAPAPVAGILTRACFDCHSNETKWPLYSNVAPFSWLVTNHVKSGRKKLNFSTIRAERIPFDEICEEMESGAMPLSSYTLVHRNAKVTKEEVKAVCAWAEKAAEE